MKVIHHTYKVFFDPDYKVRLRNDPTRAIGKVVNSEVRYDVQYPGLDELVTVCKREISLVEEHCEGCTCFAHKK